MVFRLRQTRALTAGACTALAVVATLTATAGAPGAASADSFPVLLSSAPLGLNTAPWDYEYAAPASAGGGLDAIQPLLQAADINMLRYGGGSYADYYDFQTNTNIQNCLPDNATASFTSSCSSGDSLAFS